MAENPRPEKREQENPHCVNPDMLREAYFALERDASAGVDGETRQSYGERLDENILDLSKRLKRGAYRARPGRRAYMPKADGRMRHLVERFLPAAEICHDYPLNSLNATTQGRSRMR